MPDPEKVKKAQKRAVEINGANRTAPALTAPTTPQTSLSALVQDAGATWKFSDSGSGGAVLVTSSQGESSAVKVERIQSSKSAYKCSELMQGFFSQAKGPAPFVAPRMTMLSSENLAGSGNVVQQLDAKLVALRGTTAQERQSNVDKVRGHLQKLGSGETALVTMEFAPGTQMNKLPVDDKVAMFKSEAFAQNLGRAIPPLLAFKMNDHLGVGNTSTQANPSNLMYDPGSGKLAVIDYGASAEGADASSVRFGQLDQSLRGMHELSTFLMLAAKGDDGFKQAIDRTISGEGPLASIYQSFTLPMKVDTLFSHTETGEMEAALTEEDHRRFVGNLILGSLDGVEYMQKNEGALRAAVLTTHEATQNGQTLEHFYSDKEIDVFCTELRSVNVSELRPRVDRNLRSMEDLHQGLSEVRQMQIAEEIESLLKEKEGLEGKQTQIEKKPKFTDKLKAAVAKDGEKPINKIQERVQEIEDRIETLNTEKTMLKEEDLFRADMRRHADTLRPGIIFQESTTSTTSYSATSSATINSTTSGSNMVATSSNSNPNSNSNASPTVPPSTWRTVTRPEGYGQPSESREAPSVRKAMLTMNRKAAVHDGEVIQKAPDIASSSAMLLPSEVQEKQQSPSTSRLPEKTEMPDAELPPLSSPGLGGSSSSSTSTSTTVNTNSNSSTNSGTSLGPQSQAPPRWAPQPTAKGEQGKNSVREFVGGGYRKEKENPVLKPDDTSDISTSSSNSNSTGSTSNSASTSTAPTTTTSQSGKVKDTVVPTPKPDPNSSQSQGHSHKGQ